jgi:hypothetical protein
MLEWMGMVLRGSHRSEVKYKAFIPAVQGEHFRHIGRHLSVEVPAKPLKSRDEY